MIWIGTCGWIVLDVGPSADYANFQPGVSNADSEHRLWVFFVFVGKVIESQMAWVAAAALMDVLFQKRCMSTVRLEAAKDSRPEHTPLYFGKRQIAKGPKISREHPSTSLSLIDFHQPRPAAPNREEKRKRKRLFKRIDCPVSSSGWGKGRLSIAPRRRARPRHLE